jgi:hypothetical protein
MSSRRRSSSSLRYAYPVRVGRVDEHCRIAIWRLDGRKGGFQPTGKERGRGSAGGWRMADAGILDMGESNVEKKCVPVLFPLPVGLHGELWSSEGNAELGRSNPGLVGAAALHHAVPPLSPRDESFFFLLSCRRNVPWDLGRRMERGGGEASRVSSYCMNASRTQLRRHASERGSPGAIHDQFLINHVPSFRESYFNRSRSCAIALSDSLRPTLRSLSVAVPPAMSNFERIEQACTVPSDGEFGLPVA